MKNNYISFLSIGSNIKDKFLNIERSLNCLTEKVQLLKVSSIYVTEPMYYKEQADFLNMVVKISTSLNIVELLNFCKNIESNMGRKLTQYKNRERIIDVDILTYNDIIYSDKKVTIPHPKIHERKFVLIPWCEISPNYFLINYKKNITTLLNNTKDNSKVVKL